MIGRSFDTLAVGERLSGRLTVTEAHVVLAAGIFGDFAPLHTDAVAAEQSDEGERVAHVNLVAGVMVGVLSKAIADHLLGEVEQSVVLHSPLRFGETLETEWEVVEKAAGSGRGTVRLRGISRADGRVVAEADLRLLVARP